MDSLESKTLLPPKCKREWLGSTSQFVSRDPADKELMLKSSTNKKAYILLKQLFVLSKLSYLILDDRNKLFESGFVHGKANVCCFEQLRKGLGTTQC